MTTTHTTREAWLLAAVEALKPLFTDKAQVDLPEVKVSVGFPGGGSARKRIGECWATSSGDGVAHIFISPLLVDPIDVLGTLVHEVIHAADDNKHGHRAPFARVAKAVGLTGKMTATTVGDDLRFTLREIANDLGEYPHKKVTLGGKKVQTTRMLKAACPECGYTIRLTAKWAEMGLPTCPCGGEIEMA